jgi:hypothetical protein
LLLARSFAQLDESSHDFDVCLFEVFRPDLDEPEHSARIPPPKDAAADGVSELGKKVTGVPFDVTAGVSADALYGTGFAHELTTSSQLDVEVAYLAATGGNTALYGAQGITDYGDGTVSTFSGLRLDNGNTIDLVMLYSNGALNYYSGNHDSVSAGIGLVGWVDFIHQSTASVKWASIVALSPPRRRPFISGQVRYCQWGSSGKCCPSGEQCASYHESCVHRLCELHGYLVQRRAYGADLWRGS